MHVEIAEQDLLRRLGAGPGQRSADGVAPFFSARNGLRRDSGADEDAGARLLRAAGEQDEPDEDDST
ncbi:MAG: hypothetical protein CL910_14645 [Deltaproteobacteria bacterium]|nr:hypothetical protein [Deltaproteobacteria bacterium]